MARRRKSKQSNDLVKYSVIGVAVLATLMLIINFAPTGQFYNLQTYNAYGYNAFTEPPEDFALVTFIPGMNMFTNPSPSDHDGDGVSDQKECPDLFLDSEFDGIEDIVEILQTGTDPNNADTDGDGYKDGEDSHPLDPELPIPPTLGPSDPGTGDGGDLDPGDGLTPGQNIPSLPGSGGFRTQIDNLLTGAFGHLSPGFGSGGGLGDNIKINVKPVSSFTYAPVSPTVGETIIFDGSMSNTGNMIGECSDSDLTVSAHSSKAVCERNGGIWTEPEVTRYVWYFGDNILGTGMSTTHTYEDEGTFDVTLTISVTTPSMLTGHSSTQTLVIGTSVAPPPTGIGALVSDPAAEGLLVLDWITDKKLTGRFRNCPDNPKDITKGNGIPDIIDRGSDYDGDGWTDWYETNVQKSNPLEPSDELEESKYGDSDGDGFNDKEEADASSDRADPNSIPDGQGKGETSLIVSYDSTTQVCELLIRAGESRNALAILKITDAGTVTGFVYQTRVLENLKAQTLTMSKPSNGNLCEGFLWKDWSGTSLTDKVEIAI